MSPLFLVGAKLERFGGTCLLVFCSFSSLVSLFHQSCVQKMTNFLFLPLWHILCLPQRWRAVRGGQALLLHHVELCDLNHPDSIFDILRERIKWKSFSTQRCKWQDYCLSLISYFASQKPVVTFPYPNFLFMEHQSLSCMKSIPGWCDIALGKLGELELRYGGSVPSFCGPFASTIFLVFC